MVDLNQHATEGFSIADRVHCGKLEHHSALMEPMILQSELARRLILPTDPELPAIGKFFRKVGEEIGQNFTAAPLRPDDSGYNYEFLFGGQRDRLPLVRVSQRTTQRS
jgi:hypothetical protein